MLLTFGRHAAPKFKIGASMLFDLRRDKDKVFTLRYDLPHSLGFDLKILVDYID